MISPAATVPSQGLSKAFYIPNFISESEEELLLRKIKETPKAKWRAVSNRRLQTWGGEIVPGPSGALLPTPMPSFLCEYPNVLSRIGDTGIFDKTSQKTPNHVILNEYSPGQGIMPHEDGPTYHPVVATISLGSHTVLHYYRYQEEPHEHGGSFSYFTHSGQLPSTTISKSRPIDSRPALSILLEPRSLVVTTDDLYRTHLHGIDNVTTDDFLPHGDHHNADETIGTYPEDTPNRISVANWSLLADSEISDTVQAGGSLTRGVRTSLTCRVVERVFASRILGASVL